MAWVRVAALAELPVGGMKRVTVDGEEIAIYRLPDGLYATSDVCTHAGESLTAGRLDGHVVACPKHGGKFDVRTGAAVALPCVIPLATYAVEVRGEDIYLDV
ncbi:bifunctional 3-phenylpropionate/cinnamic acid dioxygenase ferredoxin subunit [Alicyclobacillus cellulosilyticus]|uniref:Bifunctional 3-phenylpropionate/cinnamic acid dioxygenase ferredoxin subunit n=1 Tax=Alicyclobacillus cellulosilyticus TaxID=1003997 RepID=A0A917NG77_9BACL|nr:non-heme iron oxygenase ferredoxin subunit [Alicyclobacillus cellulosilyticus]GGI98790.1 bifunctional 3-phenylpropionate/cinnamic acid dioxygenase ferredoxin subunit [Alicyclobacillus cellulosilyticus]